MDDSTLYHLLAQEGFEPIGKLAYRLEVSVWWHARQAMELLVLPVGGSYVIKGSKSYYLLSIAPEGETWARDVGPLQDYLEGHFPEFRISFAHFRDVPPGLANREAIERRGTSSSNQPPPSVEQVATLQRELARLRQAKRGMEEVLALGHQHMSGISQAGTAFGASSQDLLASYLRQGQTRDDHEIDQLEKQLKQARETCALVNHFQKEYQRKGAAAVFTFQVASHLQTAKTPDDLRDAVQQVVKELADQHRYHITQKLNGGRLRIFIEQCQEPVLCWIEQWLGGALSPVQLARLGPEFQSLSDQAGKHTMAIPKEDIQSPEGAVHVAAKHLGSHVVSNWTTRLDRAGRASMPREVPAAQWPAYLGLRLGSSGEPEGNALIPLARPCHLYVSGTTGSGKSYLGRVLVEEAAGQAGLHILVLDPRNQAVGLLQPEDRPPILETYKAFGLKSHSAHGFAFQYHAPGLSLGRKLPDSYGALVRGRSIVSFKGMDDQARCHLFARILDSVFDACSREESDKTHLLVVVEEAQNFTKKRVEDGAKGAAAEAERALERIAREGRKYGLCLALISQSIKDFSHDAVSIRQNISVRMFLRNFDRELEYAGDFLDDPRQLVDLPVATAIVHHAEGEAFRMKVRPPYSKVFEPSEQELRRLLGGRDRSQGLSADAVQFLQVIRQLGSTAANPLNLSQAARAANMTSRRQVVALADELERAGTIRTRRIAERGHPRIIEWVAGEPSSASDKPPGETRTEPTALDKTAEGRADDLHFQHENADLLLSRNLDEESGPGQDGVSFGN